MKVLLPAVNRDARKDIPMKQNETPCSVHLPTKTKALDK